MAFDVVGIGLSCHDNITIIPEIPSFENKVSVSKSSEQGGGPAATAVAAASKLGLSATFLVRVGNDSSGRFIIRDFERYGVNTDNILVQNGAKSHKVIVLVEQLTGDRAFISDNTTVTSLTPADIDLELIQTAKVLHLDGTYPEINLYAAKQARKANVTVTMDATQPQKFNEELLRYVDVFIPSRFFYRDFTGYEDPFDAAKALLEYGPSEVVITLAAEGAVCANNRELFKEPAFLVDSIVDTTGCGDVFHGAYIFSKLQNWNMKRSVQFASAVAALKSQKIGGRKGIPTLRETMDYLGNKLPDSWSNITVESLYYQKN